jgi:hypothetical protein
MDDRPAPYGANDKLPKWAAERGVRYVQHASCLHWVSKGRCGVGVCIDGHLSRGRDWMDHISGWIGKDGRLLLCQPYHFDNLKSLLDACREFNLEATLNGAGWYGHGTIAIELRPRSRQAKGKYGNECS